MWSTSRRWARSFGGNIFNLTLTYFSTQHSSSTKIKGCDILQFSFSTLEAHYIIYSFQSPDWKVNILSLSLPVPCVENINNRTLLKNVRKRNKYLDPTLSRPKPLGWGLQCYILQGFHVFFMLNFC